GRGAVPRAGARPHDAARRPQDLHAADVAAVALQVAGAAGRRDRRRRRRGRDRRSPHRVRVRHPRARHRPPDLRRVVSCRLRRSDDVCRARVSARGRRPADAGHRRSPSAGRAHAMRAATAESIGVPERFNAAAHFVDRHIAEGRGARVAIECGDARITYADLQRNVNRVGTALRQIGVRREERVLLLLHDTPEFAYAFFGAIKIGAVPVPLNTLWKPADYEYVVSDARPSAIVVGRSLADAIDARQPVAYVENLLAGGDEHLDVEPTHRDAPAFWLYSSGSTGAPKGCVHLQHDMAICARLFGQGILGIRETDRTF